MKHPFDLNIADLEALNLETQELTDEEADQVTGGLKPIFTTLALGEEGGDATTLALGEEGGDFTTLALGEEGGCTK
ncbi:hypothetical protein CLI64_05560 [Nostoc sp. CENA543]|uniref:hypothetical protein n=1 Tax=Nostoc sp. CENA543 TaxID=1869241 RepID=UPI000CA39EFB|nr:hypothetical protein [Nostoc sp. CENA543]AUS99897.1 hypothetical protein CLI64_05560 [Nostoc sp. CENA543]